MSKIILGMISFYQKFISSGTNPRCRYSPTCSQYAFEAVVIHGSLVGSSLAFFRLLRCNPFTRGGYDPVPPRGFYKMGLW